MKPILFNTKMVQAILEGKKTCTRRIIKDVNDSNCTYEFLGCINDVLKGTVARFRYKHFFGDLPWGDNKKAPYNIGDILYVRETWQLTNPVGDYALGNRTAEYKYKAGYGIGIRTSITKDDDKVLGKWKPSIHMPKEAARIFLRVTDVRVERLQDITDEGG